MGGRTRPNDFINPQWLVDQSMTLHGDTVMIAGYTAGTIARTIGSTWEWQFTAPSGLPRGVTYSGVETTKESAKRAFRRSLDEWLILTTRFKAAFWKGADSQWGPKIPQR